MKKRRGLPRCFLIILPASFVVVGMVTYKRNQSVGGKFNQDRLAPLVVVKNVGRNNQCRPDRGATRTLESTKYDYDFFVKNSTPASCCDTCLRKPGKKRHYSSAAERYNDTYCGVPLDVTLQKLVYTEPNGFFVESGGQDGLFQSNTLNAERYFGWTGLLVEPARKLQSKCKENRPRSECVHGALVQFGGPGSIADPGGSPTGKTTNGTDTKAWALSALLDSRGITHVDLWSLDIEGSELNALNGVDWDRHRPVYVMIEVWEEDERIFSKMREVGYELVGGIHGRRDISGWGYYTPHRDYLWIDSRCKQASKR